MWLAACSPMDHANPSSLAGSIYATQSGQFIAPEAVLSEIARVDFVLLGETHDNAEHHRLQARLVRDVARTGRRPAIVFEMLSADQAPALARHLSDHPTDATGLGSAVGWDRAGWPAWGTYLPIGEAALASGLPIVAGDLGRATIMTLRGQGIAGLPTALVEELGLDVDYRPWQRGELERLLRESHCNQLPAATLPRMLTIQRARDAALAHAMRVGDRRQSSGGAILIAGVGHTRRDFGVPWHLTRLAPRRSVVTLAFVEIDPSKSNPADYARAANGAPLFDYVWFTEPIARDDPCAEFKRRVP